MKKTSFTVAFSDSGIVLIDAFSPIEAAIVAQAGRIKAGKAWQVVSVQNDETLDSYRIQHQAWNTADEGR